MIAIVNISADPKPTGVHQYELRINRKVIARFEHRREEGLAVCLQKAAKAADKAELREIAVLLSLFKSEENE